MPTSKLEAILREVILKEALNQAAIKQTAIKIKMLQKGVAAKVCL
jgi:hypothetical protein